MPKISVKIATANQLRIIIRELKAEIKELRDLRGRLSILLRNIAEALYGPPPPDSTWDWSQLPLRVEVVMKALQMMAGSGHPLQKLASVVVDRVMADPTPEKTTELQALLKYRLGQWLPKLLPLQHRDNCQVCFGYRGGIAGNENIEDGVTICDHCSATLLAFEMAKAKLKCKEKDGHV